jgi:hypothetical protein
MCDYLDNAFRPAPWSFSDEDGNERSRPMVDDGNPVFAGGLADRG